MFFMWHWPLLFSAVCPLSVGASRSKYCWFCVTRATVAFYSLSNACQYLTLYRLLVLCHPVHCCILQSIHCLSVPYIVLPVGVGSLCPLLSSKLCPLSVITSHYPLGYFSDTVSTAVSYSLFTVCMYLTLNRLLVLCHYIKCWILDSVHCLS
jgi:hypothetical protein